MMSKSEATGLVKYDAMCRAIDVCERVDEAQEIKRQAVALQKYLHQVRNTEAERKVICVRLRAERKAGQLLKGMEQKGERHSGRGDQKSESARATPKLTLSKLGISKNESSQYQQLAAVPEKEFHEALADESTMPTTEGVIARFSKEEPVMPPPADRRALWVWGTIKDFKREGVLALDASKVAGLMTDLMRQDATEHLPKLIAWLGDLQIAITEKGKADEKSKKQKG